MTAPRTTDASPERGRGIPVSTAVSETESAAPGGSAPGVTAPELLDRLRLASVPGLSPRLVARLVDALGSAGAVLRAPPGLLATVRGIGAARAGLVAGAPSLDDVLKDVERARAASAQILVPGADGWPDSFDELPDPPSVLWSRGDLRAALAPPRDGTPAAALGLRCSRGVAIVGSRRASSYGLAQAERLAFDLATLGITVISGLARGVDAAAHRGALRAGGRTVGVLGGGLARFYPPEHVPLAREMVAAGGAVVSEFALDVPPLPHNFPRRNRLLAALSAAVVVVEAADKSGSLLTADHALDLGREVLAVPGRVDQPNSRGVHRLLREGAALCESAADVLVALGIEVPGGVGTGDAAGPPRGANAIEQALLDALSGEDRDADALLDATGVPAAVGLAALSALELRGTVAIGGDGRYSLVRNR